MKHKLLIAMLAIMLLIPVDLSPQAASSQALDVVYVDNSSGTGIQDGSRENPYVTIADGIANVAAGGTVLVGPGTYLMEVLTIDKSLTLRGSGMDVTTIDGGGYGDVIAVTSAGLDVTVEHFKITGGAYDPVMGDGSAIRSYLGSTLYARWNWFTGNSPDCLIIYSTDVIERNLFTENGSGGLIQVGSGSTAKIYNNTLRQPSGGGTGIALADDKAAPNIRNNIIIGLSTGISLASGKASGATIEYNIVWGNGTNYGSGITPGPNNKTQDPMLDTVSYPLQGSPAINAGDPGSSYNDRDGSRNDIGMHQGPLTGASSYRNFATVSVRQPLGLAAYDSAAVWTSSYAYQPGIYRLDAYNGDPLQTMAVSGTVPTGYGGLAYDGSSKTLFHSSIYGDGIQKLNAATGNVKETLPFTVPYGGDLAYDGQTLWQAAGGWQDPKIYQIDPDTGAIIHSFASPVPGQTQAFGLTDMSLWNALWLSKGDRIYRIDPDTEAVICSFQAPLDDVRGLAVISGTQMLASSFGEDKIMLVTPPAACQEDTTPSQYITMYWMDGGTQTFEYQPAYSNEAVCTPRSTWSSDSFNSGESLPKTVGGTHRGLRLRLPNPRVPLDGGFLSGAQVTSCGEGLWAIWSSSPATWQESTGQINFDWTPPPEPGITLSWQSGGNRQTFRYQFLETGETACEARTKDWRSMTIQSGDRLPSGGGKHLGLRIGITDTLAISDTLQGAQLTECAKDGLWVVSSSTPSEFSAAYGELEANWASLPPGTLVLRFGGGVQGPKTLHWQSIGSEETACGSQSASWTEAILGPGDPLPAGAGRGIRVRVSQQDLLNVQRADGVWAQSCGGGVYALYASTAQLWQAANGLVVVDWVVFSNDLECTWFQHTETVDHSRDQESHLFCQQDGTVSVHDEASDSWDTTTVSDGYALIPAGVDKIIPGLGIDPITATLKDRLPVTVHVVPVDLVDVDIDAPNPFEYLWLVFDLRNIPFFDVTLVLESEIDVEGDDEEEIWDNMKTAMNGQPAVVGSDAYVLVASSADDPVDYEHAFGKGPFDSWKGMFFLEHPTTFIHELLHSLLGIEHVGSGPNGYADWPHATDTFPNEATFWGITQGVTWERLHFTGNDCDALMSYGNSNPYGLGSDHRVRCLSPFIATKAWTEVDDYLSSAAAGTVASAATSGPVMWLEGPDLFRFSLSHSTAGDTGTGPIMIVNPDTSPITLTVPSYRSHEEHFVDSFVDLPGGTNSAEFDGRQYPPAFGSLGNTTIVPDIVARTLTVETECAWLLSITDEIGERLFSGPHVYTQTVDINDATTVNLQLSCADGEQTQTYTFGRVYLPIVVK